MVPSLLSKEFEFCNVTVQIFSHHFDTFLEDCLGVFLFKGVSKVSFEHSFDRVPQGLVIGVNTSMSYLVYEPLMLL
jgi:hypothetical protein